MYKNAEGYNDPTAGEAMGKLTGEQKKARSDRRKAQRKKEPPSSWPEHTGA
ncbi:MAG: hypothetical protein LIP12_13215 [Clostridiales bacterium]|nr:hypothetical protein [Clostridiales bacterium]